MATYPLPDSVPCYRSDNIKWYEYYTTALVYALYAALPPDNAAHAVDYAAQLASECAPSAHTTKEQI
ncbi:hypothetical protein ACU6QD_10745 [Corynebacterium glucuronolyticum]